MPAAKLGWTWHRDVRSLTNIDAGDPKKRLVAIVENCIGTRRAIRGARCQVCDSAGRAKWYSAKSARSRQYGARKESAAQGRHHGHSHFGSRHSRDLLAAHAEKSCSMLAVKTTVESNPRHMRSVVGLPVAHEPFPD